MHSFAFVALFGMTVFAASALAEPATVYFTKDISPGSLTRIYNALGRAPATGDRVAVKISTGEAGGNNYLKPSLIAGLVSHVHGTLVECNTAYPGSRNTTEAHWRTIADHGFTGIAKVDIMDEEGDVEIPVADRTHIKGNLVGDHLLNYDFMINLAHFKGHQMGGFGGVLKNQSIGVASSRGKARIHSAGTTDSPEKVWGMLPEQDAFLESMAAAAQSVHDHFGKGTKIVYINVLNNLSIDCDCAAHPAAPKMKDIGILASLDPVALDQAAFDLVSGVPVQENDDNRDLLARIAKQHGTHIIDYAAKIGLGTKEYTLINLDERLAMDLQTVYQFLKDANTYYIATVDGDQPRVRPFGTVLIFENRLYIQTGKVKNVAKQLAANGKTEICAMKGGEWIRVSGTLVEDDRREARVAMLDAYPALRRMYDPDDGNTVVLYFKDATATISSFTAPPRTFAF